MEHKRDTYYDDPKDNTAFERCIDVMSRLMLKHGSDVLDKIEREKWEKVKEAHCKEMGNMVCPYIGGLGGGAAHTTGIYSATDRVSDEV